MHMLRTIVTLYCFAALQAAAQSSPEPVKVPGYTVEMTPLTQSAFPRPLKLPLEVDIAVAEEFVRIGFGLHLPKGKNFQSTQFLTPMLGTEQASQLIELVEEYRTFRGKPVAAAIRRLVGRVSGVEFGREGPPVIYIHLPHWTHQREGPVTIGAGTRIPDDEHAKLVEELRSIFVGQLGAQEFSPDRIQKRRIRIWWHS
jgi:hypothetical protein